jgi:hemerythrin
MKKLKWENRYNTGIREIDQQNRCLVEMLNRLMDQEYMNDDYDAVEKVLCKLMTYANSNFYVESSYMKRHAYPDLDNHIRQHVEFKQRIRQFYLDAVSRKPEVLKEILIYLMEWLADYILNSEQNFKAFFRDGQTEMAGAVP